MKKNLAEIISDNLYCHYILWSLVVIVCINLLEAVDIYSQFGKLFYGDTDPYTRALRIIDWLNDFSWHEKIFPYSNYPFGDILHFTRVMDIIWVVLSLPFMAFLPLKEAVFYGGMLLPPLFCFLCIITIIWGLRPYLKNYKKPQTPYMFAFVFTSVYLLKMIDIFSILRPDHHAVMFWLFCVNISVLLRCRSHSKSRTLLFAAGLAAGCGIWASSAIEGFCMTGSILCVLSIGWIWNKIPLSFLKAYSFGLFISTATAWLINPPYGGYAITDNLRLSVIHVVLTLFILGSFLTISRLSLNTPLKKIGALLVFTLLSLAALCLIFGINTVFSPLYTEDVKRYFLPYINEMEPLSMFNLPSLLVGAFIIIAFFYCFKIKSWEIASLTALALIFFPLALWTKRFYYYALPPVIYLNFLFIFCLFSSPKKLLAFIYIWINLVYFYSFHSEYHFKTFPEISGTVATDIFTSPQLSFEQNIKTVAMPYHTNSEAIRDNYEIFFTPDENKLKELLQKHQIEYVYFEKPYNLQKTYYTQPDRNTDRLYGKMFTHTNLYPWLEDLSHPEGEYFLYKVNRDKF